MSKSHRCLITFAGLALLTVGWLMGCSSGADDESSSTGVTASRVAPPGELGTLDDIGDLVGDVDHWYETRILDLGENGNVCGQTTRTGGPLKAAFLWDTGTGNMTYLGIHGAGDLVGWSGLPDPADSIYDPSKTDDPHGFIYSEAVAIGPNGDVICNSTTGIGWPDEDEKRAFHSDGVNQTDLPPREVGADHSEYGHYSEAFDINATYVVLNREWDNGGDILAYIWPIGGVTPGTYDGLGQIVGAGVVEPVDINNNNEVVTNSVDLTAVFHDYDVDAVQTLNSIDGTSATAAAAINDDANTGHVAGTSGGLAFFWDGGSMVSCGHLGGGSSEATDLNDRDWVVGNSTTSGGDTHAFLWRIRNGRGEITDLGTLGGNNSWATAINNNGLIVGRCETGETYRQGGVSFPVVHACAWYQNVVYDLGVHNDFYDYEFLEPYPFSEAVDVNENNRIAGNSYTPNQHYRGFVIDADLP